MANSIRIRAVENGGVTSFKSLIRHPMDSGLVKDSSGNLIPAHYITVVQVEHKGRTVFSANWGPAVSKDPFLEFRFQGAQKGDEVTLTWVDNKGETDSASATIA